MYLKKLEMQGFKSFAEKTTIELEKGITAVIGPNGSGKSNISDAIRWVLGEQSIKNLRGSKLEDVIFSGTQARKSLGFAEVEMTIDNTDGKLPVEYSEVTVTRRVYRNGESEFYINKNQCRLKDIVELFMDTGIGRDGYSIIGQGRVDEILSSKSEERRHIFEEAAGIVKHRTRKEEAEKKIENTKQNLLRINDIISEIEGQLESLEDQADKAKKFLDIREKLKYLEIGFLINGIEKNKNKLNEITNQINEIIAQVEDENNNLSSLQIKKEKIREESEKIIAMIEKEQENIFDFQNNIEKQKASISVLQERIQNNEKKQVLCDEEIDRAIKKKAELKNDKEDRASRKARLAEDKKRFEDELSGKMAEFSKMSENFTNEQKHIEELKEKMMNNINLKFEKMEVVTDLSSNIEADNRRIKQIELELEENIHELDKERMKKEDANVVLNNVTSKKNKLSEMGVELSKNIEEYNEKIKKYEEMIRETDDNLHVSASRHKFLVETENEFEGYNKAVKEVLSRCKKDKEFSANIHGALASLINVPAEYEIAIEMALGASIQNIVTETESDAKRAIDYLKNNNLGRASFLPISAVNGSKLTQNFNKDTGVSGIAADLVSYDKKYDGIVQNLLGRTLIVDNMNNAINVAKKYKYAFRIVTLDGDIINASGQMTGGSTFKKATSILGRSREIKALEKKVNDLQKKKEDLSNEFARYKSDSEDVLNEVARVQHELQEVNIEYTREAQKMDEINNNIDRFEKKINVLKGEKTKLNETLNSNSENLNNINKIIENFEKENEELQIKIKEFSSKNEEQQKIIDDLNDDIVNLKISVSSFDESALSLDEMLNMIDQEINNCDIIVNNKNEEKSNLLKENEQIKEELNSIETNISNSDDTIKKLEDNVTNLKKDRENKNLDLTAVENSITAEFKTLDILKDQSTKLDLRRSKLELDIEALQNKMWEDYETTPNTATNYAEVTSSTAKEIEKLKAELKGLGSVNVNAIEEYKSTKERYDFLNTQREDLESSEKSLNKIIEDMTRLMKIQFAEQFDIINKNFTQVFSELFGGGRATLSLSDEANILDCGIEIEAQPPGKKLQSMMLLSGGERALTAIALLFAILKLSPSPFCVLDEIEAALDDVNVYRYAEFLKKFSKDTQFLIITHRKGTMEAANTMYGVTMEEHGISKLISMKI